MNAPIPGYPYIVVSDIHLGDPHCPVQQFTDWLDGLPPNASLILNGDVLDDPAVRLTPHEEKVVRRLADISRLQPVIWVLGNNDRIPETARTCNIRFVKEWTIENRILITHGDQFDATKTWMNLFQLASLLKTLITWTFRLLSRTGIADHKPMAQRARSWPVVFDVFHRLVIGSATAYARQRGFQTIVCGHTHCPVRTTAHQTEYINTGSWLEDIQFYLIVEKAQMVLLKCGQDW